MNRPVPGLGERGVRAVDGGGGLALEGQRHCVTARRPGPAGLELTQEILGVQHQAHAIPGEVGVIVIASNDQNLWMALGEVT